MPRHVPQAACYAASRGRLVATKARLAGGLPEPRARGNSRAGRSQSWQRRPFWRELGRALLSRGTFSGVDIAAQTGLFALLPQVADAVKVPVIAAGGIADGRTVAAAFVLGASAVQLGTAFLHCDEANVLDAHRTALRAADDACTIVTTMITGRPARYVRNKLTDDLIASGLAPVPFPAQLSLTAPLNATGDREVVALFAGQSAALSRHTSSAQLVESLAAKTSRRLRSFC